MIGIIILNYINWGETIKCIQSIFDSKLSSLYHIYVIDNASPKEPCDRVEAILSGSKITFIKNKVNNGYSAGNNIGIKAALNDQCEVILIANSDIIFGFNSIEVMVKYLNENPNVGIVGPKILNPDKSENNSNICIKTGMKEKYLVRTFLSKFHKDLKIKYYGLNKDFSKPTEVYSVSGCCFMMSRKCALNITPFDENTFLFEEELILGIQMEQKGYVTIYYPQSAVIHAQGQSTKNVRAFSFICFVKSEIYYCGKYLDAKVFQILPLYFIRTISYFMRSIKYKDFRESIPTYFKATWSRLFLN